MKTDIIGEVVQVDTVVVKKPHRPLLPPRDSTEVDDTSRVGIGFDTEVEGVMLTDSVATARTDYSGADNTLRIASISTSGAAYSCANFTFPNGNKGYLPSAGEWYVFDYYRAAAEEAFNLIGGANLFSPYSAKYYWSTTQESASNAWAYASRMGIQKESKNTLTSHHGNTRAFCTL